MSIAESAARRKRLIMERGVSIYDSRTKDLYYADEELLYLFVESLMGVSFHGLPIRTRSRVAKEHACRIMGYAVPRSFTRTLPRFPHQNLEVMVQKAHNVQVWNQEIDLDRRFLIAKVNDLDVVTGIRLVHGRQLAEYDTTGTLTVKYQANVTDLGAEVELFSRFDAWVDPDSTSLEEPGSLYAASPTNNPDPASLLSIRELAERLRPIVGAELDEVGRDQERNRGATLHALVCRKLGYATYADNGQHPDIRHQLLEIKLQTSPTIDLGTTDPSSEEPFPGLTLGGEPVRHCDVRYAVFAGKLEGGRIKITNLVLVTGKEFFSRFRKMGGRVVNRKIQLHLPKNFFD